MLSFVPYFLCFFFFRVRLINFKFSIELIKYRSICVAAHTKNMSSYALKSGFKLIENFLLLLRLHFLLIYYKQSFMKLSLSIFCENNQFFFYLLHHIFLNKLLNMKKKKKKKKLYNNPRAFDEDLYKTSERERKKMLQLHKKLIIREQK